MFRLFGQYNRQYGSLAEWSVRAGLSFGRPFFALRHDCVHGVGEDFGYNVCTRSALQVGPTQGPF